LTPEGQNYSLINLPLVLGFDAIFFVAKTMMLAASNIH
jgi:hypothetical protein